MKHSELISKMTLEEKAGLCSGRDMWRFKDVKRLGVPSIMVSDGPNGLRVQHGKDTRVNVSERATCFPTSSAVACSWDRGLAEDIGAAIAREALKEDVQMVLGPGINIKRSPLCGRNFEYYSEDPLLAGEMGAAFIRGVQSQGVGACVKHFAVNNQETNRNSINAIVDERTLREIYLKAFEIAVKKGRPVAVMASYNQVNGSFATQNKKLLTDILRNEWGFEGITVSDWSAVYDRVAAIGAGLDVEMPTSGGVGDKAIVDAVKSGKLDEKILDETVDRILDAVFSLDAKRKKDAAFDPAAHDELAKRAAAESAVLLKNNKVLPLKKTDRVLLVGEFARKPRFQGAGSSFINPRKVTTLEEALAASGIEFSYERGYDLGRGKDSKKQIASAVAKAADFDKIVVCVGLPNEYEAEGFDRKNIDLPAAHNELVDRLASVGKDVIVVLSAGAPVAMPWINKVSGVLMMYLAGQNGGGACADILTGKVNPSGKLAETFPIGLDNLPSSMYFPGGRYDVLYKEGPYIGYRYTEKVDAPVLFPFGYGLSYTEFEYGPMTASADRLKDGDKLELELEIRNTGERDGKETVQLYIKKRYGENSGAAVRLAGFEKVEIAKKSWKKVKFSLDKSDFMIYDSHEGWINETCEYEVFVASNVREPKQHISVFVEGGEIRERAVSGWYDRPDSKTPVPDSDFRELYGAEPEITVRKPEKGSFTTDDSLADMAPTSGLARFVLRVVKGTMKLAMRVPADDPNLMMSYEMFRTSPMKALVSISQGKFGIDKAEAVVTMMNGHVLKGLKSLLMAI